MDSRNDSAECSTCHQLVHFDPSDKDDDEQETEHVEELPSPTDPEEEAVADEPSPEEQDLSEVGIDDELLLKPITATYSEKADVPQQTVKASTVAISSGSAARSESSTSSQGGEEKFRMMDEASRKTSSSRGRGSRSSKRRRVKDTGSKHDDFRWESDRRRRRRSDRTTILFVGGAVAAMVVLMVFLLTRGQEGSSESDQAESLQQEQMLAQQASSMKGYYGDGEVKASPSWHLDFQNSPERFMRKLKPTIAGFLKAKTWEDRLRFCADAETVRPLMEDYYKENDDGPYDYQEIFYGASVSVGEFFVTARILMADYSNRDFVMLRDDDGSWSVDWESFVGYSTMSMSEFKKVRPTEPQLFRLMIARTRPGYFNYEFSDEARWDCYVLTGRDIGDFLYAYVEKFSDSASDLNEIFALNMTAPITVMVRFPEDAPSANQVEIVEVIGQGWVPRILQKSDADAR